MDFALTDQQQQVVSTAQRVAMDCLEPRAAHYDETASHPVENWRDVWKNGLLAMAVPREYGGLGLDMLTYVMVIEKLAQGCTNTAMTVHMHSVVQRYIDALASPQLKASLYPDVVEEGRLFGSWGSEPGRRGGSGVVQTVIAPTNGGYVINGQKALLHHGRWRLPIHGPLQHEGHGRLCQRPYGHGAQQRRGPHHNR